MPGSRQIPASLRYLRARLKILARPTLWGAVSVLLLAAWFLSEYWNRSLEPITATGDRSSLETADRFDPVDQPTPLDPLSSVDEASAGENSDFLADLPLAVTASSNSSNSSADALFSNLPGSGSISVTSNRNRLLPWQSPFSSSVAPSNSDFSQVPDLPSVDLLPTASGLNRLSASAEPGSSQTSNAQANNSQANSSSVNPLQSALDRYATANSVTSAGNASRNSIVAPQPSSSNFSSTTTDLAPVDSAQDQIYAPLSLPGQAPLPQPLPGQPAPYQTLTQPVYIPQTSPPVGSTGYTPPPIFQTNFSDAAGTSNTGSSVIPDSGLTLSPSSRVTVPSIPNTASPPQLAQPSSTSAPFSIPRSVPGRSIGGGQINTFSNP